MGENWLILPPVDEGLKRLVDAWELELESGGSQPARNDPAALQDEFGFPYLRYFIKRRRAATPLPPYRANAIRTMTVFRHLPVGQLAEEMDARNVSGGI